MKYTITVNQAGIVAAGLHESTDLNDWAILSYIAGWSLSSKAVRLGDKVWIDLSHLMSELPLLGIKTKSTISTRLSKLAEMGLLETEKSGQKLFVKLTEMYLSVVEFQGHQPFAKPTDRSSERTEPFAKTNATVRENERISILVSGDQDTDAPDEPADDDENPVSPTQIVRLYNRTLTPEAAECISLTDARRKAIRARTRETLHDLSRWERYFQVISESSFLMGRVPPREGRKPFRLDIDWILNPNNCAKIIEGKYDDDE